jgi:N6-adenosine-specific RNA methylase IME4
MAICEDLLDLAYEVGKFNVCVIDAPWSFSNVKTGGTFKSGASQHYKTMTFEEIASIPINWILQKDAVMFCWVPSSLSYEIARSDIFERWGLKFKSKVYWEKTGKLGIGHYFRGQVEECWLFIKGHPKPFRSSERNVIRVKSRKHSQKPDELFDLVERETEKVGMRDRLEVFARGKPRPGWIAYGDQVWHD